MDKITVVTMPRPARLPLWKRFLLWELLEGLAVTMRHHFRKPFTVQYPEERLPLAPRFRGYPRLRSNPETGAELCTACKACEKICPDQCISIVEEPHPSGRGKRPKSFEIDYERCCLCGLCVEACPTNPVSSIYMSHDYELAKYERDEFKARLRGLYEGLDRDVPGSKKK